MNPKTRHQSRGSLAFHLSNRHATEATPWIRHWLVPFIYNMKLVLSFNLCNSFVYSYSYCNLDFYLLYPFPDSWIILVYLEYWIVCMERIICLSKVPTINDIVFSLVLLLYWQHIQIRNWRSRLRRQNHNRNVWIIWIPLDIKRVCNTGWINVFDTFIK